MNAFDLLVLRHQGLVRAVLHRVVNDAHDAEDVAQETFIRVLRSAGRFEGRASPLTWILKIATNLARDRQRRKNREIPTVPLDEAGPERLNAPAWTGPPAALSLKETSQALARALEMLPFKQRAALSLKIDAELSSAEIAAVLETSVNAVKANVHLARRRLIEKLGERL